MVLQERIKLSTSPLPRGCSSTELLQQVSTRNDKRDRNERNHQSQNGKAIEKPFAMINPCLFRILVRIQLLGRKLFIHVQIILSVYWSRPQELNLDPRGHNAVLSH